MQGFSGKEGIIMDKEKGLVCNPKAKSDIKQSLFTLGYKRKVKQPL